jgi:hypothetical protein
MKITLCDKFINGDIPVYDFKKEEKSYATHFVADWLNNKDLTTSVIVSFASYKDLPMDKLRDEQKSILVSHVFSDINDFANYYIKQNIDHFAMFEFESYQEAFRYCIDLKESY